jgi:hypothetical protein
MGPPGDLEKQLPPSLRRRFQSIERRMGNDQLLKTRRLLLRFVQTAEVFTNDLRRYSVRKRIESSEKYLSGVRQREELDDYNFRIIEDSPDPNSDNPTAQWIRECGSDARTFTVGTPYGIAFGILRVKEQYRVLFLWPWPISYDSRLN